MTGEQQRPDSRGIPGFSPQRHGEEMYRVGSGLSPVIGCRGCGLRVLSIKSGVHGEEGNAGSADVLIRSGFGE